MENREFNKILIENIPEVEEAYLSEKAIWEGEEPGSSIIVEDALMPLVYDALKTQNKTLLDKFSAWLEKMVKLDDEFVDETIFVCIFEKAFYEEKIDKLLPYFQENTITRYEQTSFVKM